MKKKGVSEGSRNKEKREIIIFLSVTVVNLKEWINII
jgi:hypothetical protein